MAVATPGGTPSGITNGPLGDIWYVDNVNRQVVHELYAAGVSKTYSVAPLGYISDVTRGADGNLWISAPLDNALGRLDPATGTIDVIPLSSRASSAGSLVSAPDGVWFTDAGPGNLVRVGYDGTLFEVASPSSWIGDGIAVDSRGAVWVSDPLSTDMFVFDPATGVFTTVATGITGIQAITPSARGGVWVAGAAELARVTSVGVSETTSIPVTTGGSAYIRTMEEGADGAVYFADFAEGLGWRNPSGAVSFLAPPMAGAKPEEVSVTSDGLLWYTDSARGTIGWRF
ncbi:Vgb family protein [Herbiconiux liukaitaii]|uniref:Vgb family protein n=1 Tax=Herbiconiux liukaitaii TaxID=3342799 RepID=UPI0035B93E00